MVNGSDDVVGLLAYALYKQTIAEDALQGQHPTSAQRNPGNVAVALYRSSAEQKLSAFAASVLEDAREGIQQNAIIDKLEEVEGRLTSHVSAKTSFGTALFTNVIGWLLTLAISILVVLLAAASGLGDRYLSRFEKAMQSPPTEHMTPSPSTK